MTLRPEFPKRFDGKRRIHAVNLLDYYIDIEGIQEIAALWYFRLHDLMTHLEALTLHRNNRGN